MKTTAKILLLTLILSFQGIMNVKAQEEGGVKFLEETTYNEAIKQAKQAGKMLFIDCYTSWCGPCKMMVRDVFPQKIVGDYFNPKFVCAKFDMEKGEGIELKKQFKVKAFPTFLIIDPNTGNEITRIVGGSPAESFLKTVDKSLSEGGLSTLKTKYETGNRDESFVKSYIKALENAYMSDECAKVAAEFLKGKEDQLLGNEELFDIYMNHIQSPYNETFKYVWAHKNEFIQKYGEKVNQQLKNTWTGYPVKQFIIKGQDGAVSFNETGMKEYISVMEKANVDNIDYIKLNTQIALCTAKGEWKELLNLGHQYDKQYKATDVLVYNWCLRIEQKCTDQSLRQEAANWLKERLVNINKAAEEQAKAEKDGATPAMSMTDGAAFKKPYEGLIKRLETPAN